jgi:hypothetical protein
MKKNKLAIAVAVLLSCSALSSCIGSFALTHKVLDWNKNVGDKFVNEVVFLCFHIIPVYPVAMFADAVVFNSLEFWDQPNPIAANNVKYIKGNKGNYKIESNQAGYVVTNQKTKEVMTLSFNKESKSWEAQSDGQTVTFLTFVDATHVKLYGSDKVIELSQAGVLAYQAMVSAKTFIACK